MRAKGIRGGRLPPGRPSGGRRRPRAATASSGKRDRTASLAARPMVQKPAPFPGADIRPFPAGAHPGRFDERGAAPFAGVDYDPQGHHPPPPEPEPDPSDEGGGEAGAGLSAAVRARLTQTGAIARRYSADA